MQQAQLAFANSPTVQLIRLVPHPTPHLREHCDPVRVLWARVIVRAIYDYVKLKDAKKLSDRREFESVKKWLFEPSSLTNGLENLCRILNLPVNVIRQKALTMTSKEVRKLEFREREHFDCRLGDG